MRDIPQLIEHIETTYNCPVFYLDVKKDDIEKNKSFFIYNDKGEITKGQGLTFIRSFYIHYVTSDGSEIDEIQLIKYIQKNHSLIFDKTAIDVGKIQNLDTVTQMTTFEFHYIVGCGAR